MAKVKLGNRPKNFPAPVSFPMLDGSTGSIQVSCKYRTKKEFGAFIDGLMDAAGVKPSPDADVKLALADLMASTIDQNAHYILQAIDGWNLDEPFTLDNVKQLCDEIPAAAQAIMETYRTAITEGRLGN